MKYLRSLAILGVAAGLFAAAPAHAVPKPSSLFWWEGPFIDHWKNLDFVPHMEDAKHPQNSQWEHVKPTWKPDDWIAQRASADELVHDLYASDVFVQQKMNRNVPVLIVGPGFYKLGGYDKRRVTALLDQVYGITTSAPDGMYLINDWTGMPVGAYTRYGLQLQ